MTTISSEKRLLRQQLRQWRNSIPAAEAEAAARTLYAQVHNIPQWQSRQHIAGYIAADGELDPAHLLVSLHDSGRQIYLPVIAAESELRFAPWHPGAPMRANRFGIPEPATGQPTVSAAALDAVLMPLVGWDRSGLRLGMGGGYYDRALEDYSGLRIGLAYTLQEVDSLPGEPWDIRMDFVVTERALHKCGG